MDQPDLPAKEHHAALTSLARINWISRSARALEGPIFAAARLQPPGRPLRVLDLACGGGDVLVTLALEAERRGLAVQWLGCDVSATAIEHAREQAADAQAPIQFSSCDVLRDPLPPGCDVVMCSLFLHHLADEDALRLLIRLRETTERMVLVQDLIRSHWGYWLAQVGCRLLTRSSVVHYDGPISVAGAYTLDEVRRLADQAGLPGATFSRHWPQRFLLRWSRP